MPTGSGSQDPINSRHLATDEAVQEFGPAGSDGPLPVPRWTRMTPSPIGDSPENSGSFDNRFGKWGSASAGGFGDTDSPVLRALQNYKRSAAPDGPVSASAQDAPLATPNLPIVESVFGDRTENAPGAPRLVRGRRATGLAPLFRTSLRASRTWRYRRLNAPRCSGSSAASRCRHRAFRRRCGACRIIRTGPTTATCSIFSPVLPSRIRRSRHRRQPAASRCDPWAGGSSTNRRHPYLIQARQRCCSLRLTIQISRAASWAG